MEIESKKKVLIVDDSEMVRKFHGYIIKSFGYEVTVAENGVIALEKLLCEDYQLLVTDINMPKMDGYELIKNIIEQGILIPIIIVSTEEEYKIGRTGVDPGYYVHLPKPTNPEVLMNTVKMLLSC